MPTRLTKWCLVCLFSWELAHGQNISISRHHPLHSTCGQNTYKFAFDNMTNEMASSCRGRLRRDSGKAKRENARVPLYFCRAPFPVRPGALKGPFCIQVTVVSIHKTFWEKDMLKEKKIKGSQKENKKVLGMGVWRKKHYSEFFFSFCHEKANKGTVEWIVTDKNVSSSRSQSRWRHRRDLVPELKVSGAQVGWITPNRFPWLLVTTSWAISCLCRNKKCFYLGIDIPLLAKKK